MMFPPLTNLTSNIIDIFTRGPSLELIETIENTTQNTLQFTAGFITAALATRIVNNFISHK